MNRNERIAMIERLEQANLRDTADLAERRAARIEHGDDLDDVIEQPRIVRKTLAPTTQPQPQDWAAWNAWCDARIKAAIEREREVMREVMGQVIAELRREFRNTVLAETRRALDADDAVIELPAFPLRNRHAA